ncbi:Uncharacterised protein [Mycobacteroides abscessus subsp. abscessus]|nr:Uncharacterised protein [Mycobacteroides abscessus subsp. abscessus]
MGAGSAFSIAARVAVSSPLLSRNVRTCVVSAPRPITPRVVASNSSAVTGSTPSRAPQRGRRHRITRDSSSARSPCPGSSSPRISRSSLRSCGAAVDRSESERAAIGLSSLVRLPIRSGRAASINHADIKRNQRVAVGSSANRSACVVGAQCQPSASVSTSGSPTAISSAAASTSSNRPMRLSSRPVAFASRLTSRTPSPPLRSWGAGLTPSSSSSRPTSRSKSRAAPAAAASASDWVAVVVSTAGGCRRSGSSPRSSCATNRGSNTVSSSMRCSRPAASSRCTGRSGGAPGAASRVRPMGDPAMRARSSSMPRSSAPANAARASS